MKINVNFSLRAQIAKFLAGHSQLLDRYQYVLMALIVGLLLYWCINCLERPVSVQQRLEISTYTTQYLYPYSREMASGLLAQEQAITQFQYFKLLRVLHREQSRIHYQEDKQQ